MALYVVYSEKVYLITDETSTYVVIQRDFYILGMFCAAGRKPYCCWSVSIPFHSIPISILFQYTTDSSSTPISLRYIQWTLEIFTALDLGFHSKQWFVASFIVCGESDCVSVLASGQPPTLLSLMPFLARIVHWCSCIVHNTEFVVWQRCRI